MPTSIQQVQLKISLSPQLDTLLKQKSASLGLPVAQYVKHLVIKEVEKEEYPFYKMSIQTKRDLKQALKDYDQAVEVKDVDAFFDNLK